MITPMSLIYPNINIIILIEYHSVINWGWGISWHECHFLTIGLFLNTSLNHASLKVNHDIIPFLYKRIPQSITQLLGAQIIKKNITLITNIKVILKL